MGRCKTPDFIQFAEVAICFIIIADYLLFFFISEQRVLYIFGFQSFISYITVIPSMLIRLEVVTDPDVVEKYFLDFWKVNRLFSVFRIIKVFTRRNMPMTRVWFRVIFFILLIMFTFGAAMQTFENYHSYTQIKVMLAENVPMEEILSFERGNVLHYHDILYYMIVTLTSVGYGDICPKTIQGQYSVILIVIVFISVLQKQISDFSKVNSLTSEYSRVEYIKSQGDIKHILLLGDSQHDAINTFLKECFHSDHGAMDTDVVILRSGPPTEEINNVLKNPQFESKVIYLQGSALSHEDLRRCQAQLAQCAVIMSNKFC